MTTDILTNRDYTELMAAPSRRERAAAAAGVEQVGTYKLELAKLRENYILVQVNVTGSSIFWRHASFGELGIADADLRRMRYTPGQKSIFPRELPNRWRSVENRARDSLIQLSFPLTGFAPYRAMPWTAINQWRTRFQAYEKEAISIRDELLANYDLHIANYELEFAGMARAAWRSLNAQGFDGIRVSGQLFLNENEFVEATTSRAMARIPSREEIQKKLKISYSCALVYGQEDIAADEARAEEIRQQSATASERQRHERTMMSIEERERREKANAAITAEINRAREQMTETDSYVDQIFQEVRDRVAAGAREMLESVKKNGFLKGKVAERGAGLLDLYNTLGGCIHNDTALQETLTRLRSEIGPVGAGRGKDTPNRDATQIAATLREIVDLAENELADLTDATRAGFIEL